MKLSVALCTYNGEKYIKKQLESILNQELPIDEIIICDDRSQDNTIQLIEELKIRQKKDNIFITVNPTQLGVIKNFEKAIQLCSGDIIFCADQDDIWYDYKTKTIINYFNAHPDKKFVFTNANLIDYKNDSINNRTLFDASGMNKYHKVWDYGLYFEIINATGNKVTGCTMAFKREITKYVMPLYPDIMHDYQFAIAMIKKNTIGIINTPIMKYRIHNNNVCGIGKDNWVLKKRAKDSYKFKFILEPVKTSEYFVRGCTPNTSLLHRMNFQNFRQKNITTIKGRIYLAFSIMKYIKYYGRYSLRFYFSDLLYGVFSHFKCKRVL